MYNIHSQFVSFSYSTKHIYIHDFTIFEIKFWEASWNNSEVYYIHLHKTGERRRNSENNLTYFTSFIFQSLHPYNWSTSFHAHSFVYFQKISHMYVIQYNCIHSHIPITHYLQLKSQGSRHVKPCWCIQIWYTHFLLHIHLHWHTSQS